MLVVKLLEEIKRQNPGTTLLILFLRHGRKINNFTFFFVTRGTLFDVTSCPTSKDGPYKYFHRAAWAIGLCIVVFPHLRTVITIECLFPVRLVQR